MDLINILTIYFCMVNLITFLMFGIDKRKAQKDKWRISEKALLLSCLAGGSLGGTIGMRYFHHKTRKNIFWIGVPLIFIVQAAVIIFIKIYFF
ncbi:DUF1294 domain-containing protein [Eubacteriaceae bacterium ES3]|nr:DUF1294 domain-containing protein [Eubacteriaceae bacterium ES3]